MRKETTAAACANGPIVLLREKFWAALALITNVVLYSFCKHN